LITIVEAGEILGLQRSAAYRAAKAGDIKTLRIGERYRVPVAWLEELLGENLDLDGSDATPHTEADVHNLRDHARGSA
jgi:excisionase family DNA binding protein